jgi:hypothetical protein
MTVPIPNCAPARAQMRAQLRPLGVPGPDLQLRPAPRPIKGAGAGADPTHPATGVPGATASNEEEDDEFPF